VAASRSSSRGDALELVLRELRADILGGRLQPGERIGQAAVAGRLGVSRSPVREALRALEAEGLVAQISNVGARVVALDADDLDEVYWIRERVEPGALAEAVGRLTATDRDELRAAVAGMEAAAAAGRLERWHELDREFHVLPLRRGAFPRVLRLLDGLYNQSAPYRRAYTVAPAFPEALAISHAEHRLLLDAIERRDGPDAERLLAVHIRRTRLALREHPELFESNGARLR